jgi:hypothetical protein
MPQKVALISAKLIDEALAQGGGGGPGGGRLSTPRQDASSPHRQRVVFKVRSKFVTLDPALR